MYPTLYLDSPKITTNVFYEEKNCYVKIACSIPIVIKFNKPDQSIYLTVDPERMRQVIRHILSNAVGLSPENQKIVIDLKYNDIVKMAFSLLTLLFFIIYT